ncbi:uncharacterized protein LOC132703840 [Cylas formicarius]|uniref:uncharacterized protein LOC132703840 n=1 Tax=Cylas formicarius TaxID=197179 RepID=UPI002958992B|nr:uncharacterized protein LOC132703840 [Cylas formicarius]
MYPKSLVYFVLLFGSLAFGKNIGYKDKGDRGDFKRSLSKNCDDSYSLTCLKLNVISWVDKLNEDSDYSVLPGVSIVRENSSAVPDNDDVVAADLARNFPSDPNGRLDAFLQKKVSGFLDNHSIKLKLGGGTDSAFTGRKKDKGGGNGLGAILALGAMMKGALMSMALAGIAALAGKALMTSLISLLLSLILGLKHKGGGEGHSTYEIVAKPSHGHGDWGRRSLDAPLPSGLQPDYKLPE